MVASTKIRYETKTTILGSLEPVPEFNGHVIDNDITVVKMGKDKSFVKRKFDVSRQTRGKCLRTEYDGKRSIDKVF